MSQKFELFGGRLGNGITVCNKAVIENNDYKIIAHISEGGIIKWRIDNPDAYVPPEDMAIIKKWADSSNREFIKKWEPRPDLEKYQIMLDTIGYAKLLSDPLKEELKNCADLHEKVLLLQKIYFENYI